MLNSFEYVDPILAQKIHTLEMELKKVRQTQEEIMSNAKLMPNTRDKLLRYQKECSQNIERMLAE
jgi:phage shock protein A